ncbi:SIMPL domain-containing protein [Adhaeribacter aquaticus]|uniref:SIMPL domain-containing protein n=1 Tax=Adhaeribacter aquaticus TaxID=299567 RepID=UPI00041B4008|nr:SIMPL domain-containing protein [Adhaeribacter aquaticus]
MKNALNTSILALAVIITALILGNSWTKSKRPPETINVTGSASTDFTSDLIVWRASFSRKSLSIQDAYTVLKKDAANIRKYLLSKGVNEKEIVFSAVDIQKNYRSERLNENMSTEVFDGYTLVQNISIESKEVDKVEKISREITELIDLDIELYSQAPEYFYTRLSELKIEMLAKATADGRLRGTKIADNAGSEIGSLKSANMGIFQITGQNSSESFSYGGTFNTIAKQKTASITVKLEFGVD